LDVSFFNKWLHLTSIVCVLGGIFFAWFVLVPTLKDGDETDGLARRMWKRFGMAFGVLWLIVLATGFLNMYLVTPKVNAHYQMILGIKTLLALGMFFVSMLIAHPMKAMARFFGNRGPWLLALLLAGIVVLGLSAHLNLSRISGAGLKPAAPNESSGP
jgi:putative copper export protein